MELVIKDYTKIIRKVPVLDQINLTLTGGKIYGLRGKNGSGKTMLMRAITGLIRPTAGYVAIDGKKIGKDIDFPQSVGALIETPSFIQEYSAMDNLKVLAKLSGGIPEEDIRSILERVGLNAQESKPFGRFSLGMKQKLGIAAAVMGKPQLIILDEPINALDEYTVERIKELLLELRSEDRIILVACHDREELDYLSDVIIHIQEGRIVNDR